jgi:hypothetical protein
MVWRKWSTIGQSKDQDRRPSMQWEDVGSHEPQLKNPLPVSFEFIGPRARPTDSR